jgi:hypothetical protein
MAVRLSGSRKRGADLTELGVQALGGAIGGVRTGVGLGTCQVAQTPSPAADHSSTLWVFCARPESGFVALDIIR